MYAVLVVNERHNGKPRQRVLKHLGGINLQFKTHPIIRCDFWERMESALSSLELTAEQKAVLLESIGRVVAPLTVEEAAKMKRPRM